VENDKENTGGEIPGWKKRLSRLITVGFVIYGIFRLILCFQVIEYKSFREPKGKKILMFAVEPSVSKIIERRPVWGVVIGRYVLKTEYGEITLRTFCGIRAGGSFLHVIESQSFKKGRASHNLVVRGIKMPKDIDIVTDNTILKIQRFSLDRQEITVSCIPLGVGSFYLMYPDDPVADIVIKVYSAPEYITLSDSTQINFRFIGTLSIYDETERWVLSNTVVPVKLPGETEFREYKSITFKKDWGDFIEGELLDEDTQ
jgi:hypothetical protein